MLKKLRDFAATLATSAPYLTLLPAIGGHELQKKTLQGYAHASSRKPHSAGIYINTANSCRFCGHLRKNQLLRKIQVVTTDLFPEPVPLIEAGKILATIYQRPFTHGRIALETLLWFLTKKIEPVSTTTKLAPTRCVAKRSHPVCQSLARARPYGIIGILQVANLFGMKLLRDGQGGSDLVGQR
jgi:LacI family transcriptional regulator